MLTSAQEDVPGKNPNSIDVFAIYCSLKVTSILAFCTLTVLSAFSVLSWAQNPPLLEIAVVPQAEYAVAGQVFTYTIVLTNVGQRPVQQIIVYAEIPSGTTFANASYNTNWFISEPALGEIGFVGWASRDFVEPGAVVNFELAVKVLPEMAKQRLVSGQYGVGPMGGSGDIIVSGHAVEIEVLATPPTPTLTPTATNTATLTPTAINTATATPAATSSKTLTPQPTATQIIETTPTPVSPTPTTKSSFSIIAAGGVFLILLISSIGLVWFLKQRRS